MNQVVPTNSMAVPKYMAIEKMLEITLVALDAFPSFLPIYTALIIYSSLLSQILTSRFNWSYSLVGHILSTFFLGCPWAHCPITHERQQCSSYPAVILVGTQQLSQWHVPCIQEQKIMCNRYGVLNTNCFLDEVFDGGFFKFNGRPFDLINEDDGLKKGFGLVEREKGVTRLVKSCWRGI